LPKHPPDFIPSEKFTEERREKMKMNPSGFLWLEEEKLVLFDQGTGGGNSMGSDKAWKLHEG